MKVKLKSGGIGALNSQGEWCRGRSVSCKPDGMGEQVWLGRRAREARCISVVVDVVIVVIVVIVVVVVRVFTI